MRLIDIIDLKINQIRYSYEVDEKLDMNSFFYYLKLENGLIVRMPYYKDETFQNRLRNNLLFYFRKKPDKRDRKLIEGSRIKNFHFYYEGISAIIELENGHYFFEDSTSPIEIPWISLNILSKADFEQIKREDTHDKIYPLI